MQHGVEAFTGISLVVIGLSHLIQPRAWASYFMMLKAKGVAGVFVVAFMAFNFGVFLVAFHNVWRGVPIIVTLLGWSQLIKGSIYFLWPQGAARKMDIIRMDNAWIFRPPGVVMAALGALVLLHANGVLG